LVLLYEPMVLTRRSTACAGHVLSVEPGIYLSWRFGVLIEDIVTVTAHGGRRLNNTDHGLRVVE
jgi:Xaa-Pro aminopeptidase